MQPRTRRGLLYAAALVVVAGLVFVGLRGCTAMPWNRQAASTGMVSVSVTRDCGRTLVKTGQVRPAAGDTVLDVLKRVAKVDTQYGGGFVSAIDGTASTTGTGGKQDWFYYVNGVLAGVGSTERKVSPDDLVWWDFHSWSGGDFIPAVVGAYPRPFTRGYTGKQAVTTMLYGAGMEPLAREVGAYLAGKGAKVASSGQAAGYRKGAGPTIIFLTVQQAEQTGWAGAFTGREGKPGAFVSIAGGKLVPLDVSGKPAPAEPEICAAVVATGTGMGDGAPVWLVLCNGEGGVAQARRLLVTEPKLLELKVGMAADRQGALYPLPR